MFDVWMTIVMAQVVTRDYGRYGPSPIDNPQFLSLLRSAMSARREGDATAPGALRAAAAALTAAADDADAA